MTDEKINFFKSEYLPSLRKIDPSRKPLWGKMNYWQMLEHMSDSIRIANGKAPHELHTPVELVGKFKAFILTEKPFKENTKNALLGEDTLPVRNASVEKALEELQTEVTDFLKAFEPDPERKVMNPFFGELNFREWVQLLHKHAIHHLKQFGVN
jgi:hypothetical protein